MREILATPPERGRLKFSGLCHIAKAMACALCEAHCMSAPGFERRSWDTTVDLVKCRCLDRALDNRVRKLPGEPTLTVSEIFQLLQ